MSAIPDYRIVQSQSPPSASNGLFCRCGNELSAPHHRGDRMIWACSPLNLIWSSSRREKCGAGPST